MAHIYVDSNAAGTGSGADWTNAYTTLKAAAEAAGTAAGDNIWVAQDHAETQASAMSISFKNTLAAPGTAICVNKAGSVPPVSADLATTATVTTTGANALTITSGVNNGKTWIQGIQFSAGSGAVNSTLTISGNHAFVLKNCKLVKAGTTGVGGAINISCTRQVLLINTTMQFGATTDTCNVSRHLDWRDTSSAIAGATLPTNLFGTSADNGITLRGIDLSALGSGKTIFSTTTSGRNSLLNCKLGSSVAFGVPVAHGGKNIIVNADSGDTNYRTEAHDSAGSLTTETTIVRTSGASDGTTPIAWKIVTNANAEWLTPFESLPITIWNETLTEQTLTVYGFQDAAAVPTNREIWMEVEYLGTSGFPISSIVSSGAADFLATAANTSADASTWGDGSDTTTPFKMTATFTAAEKGPITVRIYVAKASATFYIDPKVALA